MARLLMWLLGVPISVALMIASWGVPSESSSVAVKAPTVSLPRL